MIFTRRSLLKITGGALPLAAALAGRTGFAKDSKSAVPAFEVDPSWPKLPDNLRLGMLTGLAVDRHDHVWVLHRKANVKIADGSNAKPAPSIVEFDASGRYVQGWGGPGEGYDWPHAQDEHGMFVDYQDNVWTCAGGGPDKTEAQAIKFTKSGKFLLQIGHRGKGKGSNDLENLGNAADVYVYPKTNEVFIADGYSNRRVIVFDATTGAYKRHWGAYGNKPDDSGARGSDIHQFAIVHHVRVSNDGLVYVAARQDGRMQVFTLEGKYLNEVYLDKDTKDGTGVASIVFSHDPQQQFIFVADLSKRMVHVLNRTTLERVGQVSGPGDALGQLRNPHNIAADSKGNLYVAELGLHGDGDAWAGRVQKFVIKS